MHEGSEDIAYRLHNLECDVHHTVKQVARSIRLRSLNVFDQRCVRIVEEPPGAITAKIVGGTWRLNLIEKARREEEKNKHTTIERNTRSKNKHTTIERNTRSEQKKIKIL
jgi:hypothetical protein